MVLSQLISAVDGINRLTRSALYVEAKAERTAGHMWQEAEKDLKCNLFGCEFTVLASCY